MKEPSFDNLLEYFDATTVADIEPTDDGSGVFYHASPFPDLDDLRGGAEVEAARQGSRLIGVHFSQEPHYALIHAALKVHNALAIGNNYFGRSTKCRIYRVEAKCRNPLIVDRPGGPFSNPEPVSYDEERRYHARAVADGYDAIKLVRADGLVSELVALPGCQIVNLSEMGAPCPLAHCASFRFNTAMPLFCEEVLWDRLLPNALRSLGITRLIDPSSGNYKDTPDGPFDRWILPSWAKNAFA